MYIIFKWENKHFVPSGTFMSIKSEKEIFQIYFFFLEAATGGVLQKSDLKIFAKFTGKHLHRSLFLIKLRL